MNNCSAKQKKTIVKLYKGNLQEVIKYNNVSYVTIIKLITEIYDTVFINKTIVDELLELLPSIFENKNVFRVIFALFSEKTHNMNVLGKYEKNTEKTMCKKPYEDRVREIRAHMYPSIIDFLSAENGENMRKLCKLHQ